ncbi:MAG: hypothetical protein NZM25_10720 [Leptospiraceae bacterium]|nr:hypothetical protein [Leptospiraceae bacterium]MDW8305901.1 hypothetical protein [Leptospiraceae bacterium]
MPLSVGYAQENLEEDPGSLGIALTPRLEILTSESLPSMELSLWGLAQEYDIEAELKVFFNIFYQGNLYKAKPFQKNVYPYSLGRLCLDYRMARFGFLQWQLGYLVGHKGFLHRDFPYAAHQVQLGLQNMLLYFINRFLMFKQVLALPLPVYQRGHDTKFLLESSVELILSLKGRLERLQEENYFLSLGLEGEYISLNQAQRNYEEMVFRPYVRVYFFY